MKPLVSGRPRRQRAIAALMAAWLIAAPLAHLRDAYAVSVIGGSHQLKAFGNASATVQAAGNVVITASSQSDTGLIQGSGVYLGGSLSNGITDYLVATPAPRLPDAVVNLGGQNLPVGAVFTPNATTLFSSASRLALMAPIRPDSLNALLPPELRAGGRPASVPGCLGRSHRPFRLNLLCLLFDGQPL